MNRDRCSEATGGCFLLLSNVFCASWGVDQTEVKCLLLVSEQFCLLLLLLIVCVDVLVLQGTLRGEELLCQGYLADVAAAEQEDAMMRESMDVALATMNMAKHLQVNKGCPAGCCSTGALLA